MYYKFFNVQKFTCCFLFFLALNFASLRAQDSKVVDSLTTIINAQTGKSKIDALIALSLEYFDVDNQIANRHAVEAYKLATESGDTAQIVKSGRIRGQLLRRLDRLEESSAILRTVQGAAKRHRLMEDYKRILNALALNYTFMADYDQALKYHFESLIIRENEGDKAGISVALNNIGLVHFKLRNYDAALDYYKRAIKIKREINDADLDRVLINAGLCYNQKSDYSTALTYFQEAFQICGNDCNPVTQIEGKFGLGVAYHGMGNFEEATKYFKESHAIAKENENKRFQAENLVYIGKIAIAQNQIETAVKVLSESEKLSTETGYEELLIDTYRQFSILYYNSEDLNNAANYQRKYILLKDSVYSGKLMDNMAKIQAQYEERKNIATIAAKEEVIQRQRNLNIAIVIIAVLASLLIFVLYRSNLVKKKVNQALSDAKAIIEGQNKQLLNSNFSLDRELKERNIDLQKANDSLQRVNEELDNFIYKTSHDIRGPLASLKGMCNVALMDVKDVLALNYLKKLDITAEKLNTILTRLLIVNQINNSALGSEKIDFGSIVTDVLILEKKKGLPPRLKVSKMIDDDIVYYSDREFVRIILENLIDNAIKFYNDSERVEPFVDISVTEEDNHVKIKVVDNGIGISQVHPDKIFQMFSRASERSETGGIGLYITKTATEKLGGEVNLKTTPEGFTEFFVLLPLSMAGVAMA